MYADFIKERFERCLDLYLCPRVRKKRMHIDPESLVPKLPKPQDLQPFPTQLGLRFLGHRGKVGARAAAALLGGAENDGGCAATGRLCFLLWGLGSPFASTSLAGCRRFPTRLHSLRQGEWCVGGWEGEGEGEAAVTCDLPVAGATRRWRRGSHEWRLPLLHSLFFPLPPPPKTTPRSHHHRLLAT
jgi:ribosome biogenesis protein ERB1